MELDPPRTAIRIGGTTHLIPTRFPPVGIFDTLLKPEDLPHVFDLEGWTNDRILDELGQLTRIPAAEWLHGVPNASVVMAAFCHPHAQGGRFTGPDLGAWYAALELETAHKEVIHRKTPEMVEVGTSDLEINVRQYLADFDARFHDVRDTAVYAALYDPHSYDASQPFGLRLRAAGSEGIVYESVRNPGQHCVVAFKPKLVTNVRQGAHFRYVWAGGQTPTITRMAED